VNRKNVPAEYGANFEIQHGKVQTGGVAHPQFHKRTY